MSLSVHTQVPKRIEVPAQPRAAFPSAAAALAEWFDGVYRAADGDPGAVPWADGRPSPHLVSWLNAEAFGLIRPGCRVAVVGCGLGDDVAELARRGYDALGFDISPTAVDWARRRFPDLAPAFTQADLLALPSRLCRRFDLVVEIDTLPALPPELRTGAARAVASLAGSKGCVLAVCRAREESVSLSDLPAPPWPLTEGELRTLMHEAGLRDLRPVERLPGDEDGGLGISRLRGLFGR